jgi:hypothetical protein
MIDYQKTELTSLSNIQKLWLRLVLAYVEWDAENETRLIDRVQEEVDRGVSDISELCEYKHNRIRIWNRANEIRNRLRMSR